MTQRKKYLDQVADSVTDYLFPGSENKKKKIKDNQATFMNLGADIGN